MTWPVQLVGAPPSSTITPEACGAKGDLIEFTSASTGAFNSSTSQFTDSVNAPFRASDVGKFLVVTSNAIAVTPTVFGPYAVFKVTSWIAAATVTVSVVNGVAIQSASGLPYYYASDDTAAVATAFNQQSRAISLSQTYLVNGGATLTLAAGSWVLGGGGIRGVNLSTLLVPAAVVTSLSGCTVQGISIQREFKTFTGSSSKALIEAGTVGSPSTTIGLRIDGVSFVNPGGGFGCVRVAGTSPASPASGVRIVNCTAVSQVAMPSGTRQLLVSLLNCNDVLVSGCTSPGLMGGGASVFGCSGVQILDNDFSNGGTITGFGCQDLTIRGNDVSGYLNPTSAIQAVITLSRCAQFTIEGNSVQMAQGYGIGRLDPSMTGTALGGPPVNIKMSGSFGNVASWSPAPITGSTCLLMSSAGLQNLTFTTTPVYNPIDGTYTVSCTGGAGTLIGGLCAYNLTGTGYLYNLAQNMSIQGSAVGSIRGNNLWNGEGIAGTSVAGCSTDGVTTTLTALNAYFTPADVGRPISGGPLGAGTYISAYLNRSQVSVSGAIPLANPKFTSTFGIGFNGCDACLAILPFNFGTSPSLDPELIHVEGNICSNANYEGIILNGADQNTSRIAIDSNFVRDCQFGILCKNAVSDVTITGNTVIMNLAGAPGPGVGGIVVANGGTGLSTRISVMGNTVENISAFDTDGIFIDSSANVSKVVVGQNNLYSATTALCRMTDIASDSSISGVIAAGRSITKSLGEVHSIRLVSAFPSPVNSRDSYLLLGPTSGTQIVNLPDCSSLPAGTTYVFKGTGAGGSWTLTPFGTQKIDLAATQTISAFQALRLVTDGSNWWIS